MAAGSDEMQGSIQETLQLQQMLLTGLKEENRLLSEVVKQKDQVIEQKDLAIAQLKEELRMREAMSSAGEDGDVAGLRLQNARLQKLVLKKQKTIKSLMQTLQSALGGQSSDGDLLGAGSDGESQKSSSDGNNASASYRGSPSGKKLQVSSGPEHRGLVTPQQATRASPSAAAATARAPVSRPAPARNAAAKAVPSRPPAKAAASPASSGQDQSRMSKASRDALQVLSKGMQALEEKKRYVEMLAQNLDPGSDDEAIA